MSKSKKVAFASGLATAAFALCLAVGAPSASTAGATGLDSGILPEAPYTTILNEGNRGCAACHTDLYELTADYRQHLPYKNLATYGQDVEVKDCMTCHRPQAVGGGPMIGDAMHQIHYSNPAFMGNCFTCHATTNAGELVLWDEFKYTGELGGFPAEVGAPNWLEWYEVRGRVSGGDTIAGISLISNWEFDSVVLDQRISSLDDLFCSVNGEVLELSAEDYVLTVASGVNNPRSFTFEELQGLGEVVVKGSFNACAGNGMDCTQIGNTTATGVMLADVIEACGGLVDGVITVERTTVDGFPNGLATKIEEDLAAGAMLIWEYNGEPLSAEEGAPVRYYIPGWPAYSWTKYLVQLDFTTNEFWGVPGWLHWYDDIVSPEGQDIYNQTCDMLNSAWFTPASNYETYKVGEPIQLEGYVACWQCGEHETSAVLFSADYGYTWTEIPVEGNIENYDNDMWVYFTATWTPTEPGVYVLHVKPADAAGYDTQTPASTFITVTE